MNPELYDSLNYKLHIENMSLQTVRERLSAIPADKRGELRTKLVPWIFTNDTRFDQSLDAIKLGVDNQKHHKRPKSAIISGVGAIQTVAPYLNVDVIVAIDRNTFVLDQIHKMVGTLKECATRNEYFGEMQYETFFELMRLEGVDPEPYFTIEKESFGEKHFLATDVNYDKSRQALSNIPILFSQGNFTHRPFIEELSNALRDTQISYANFTDLGEWYPAFFQEITALHLADDSVISWSTNQDEGKPSSRVSLGLEEYLEEAQKEFSTINVNYFRSHV